MAVCAIITKSKILAKQNLKDLVLSQHSLRNVIPLYNEASPTENLCDYREGQEFMLDSLGSYMHLEMCQSLMLTAKVTLGQRSAPQGSGYILHN